MSAAIHVAFVRAVMIGREGLRREVLLGMFDRAGAAHPTSYLATGNVSFAVDPARLGEVVDAVEADLAALLGRATPLFVRTLDELRDLVASDPFADPPMPDVVGREVTMFRDRVPAHLDLPIESPRGDWVVFAAREREVLSVQRLVDGRTQSPGGRIERLAGQTATTRAIGTIERIVAKL